MVVDNDGLIAVACVFLSLPTLLLEGRGLLRMQPVGPVVGLCSPASHDAGTGKA